MSCKYARAPPNLLVNSYRTVYIRRRSTGRKRYTFHSVFVPQNLISISGTTNIIIIPPNVPRNTDYVNIRGTCSTYNSPNPPALFCVHGRSSFHFVPSFVFVRFPLIPILPYRRRPGSIDIDLPRLGLKSIPKRNGETFRSRVMCSRGDL